MTVDGFRDRNGKLTARVNVLIDFGDGYRWHSEDNRDFKVVVDADFVDFLQQKTAMAPEHAETEAELSNSSAASDLR